MQYCMYTVDREFLAAKIFHQLNCRMALFLSNKYFTCLISSLKVPTENSFTPKISQSTAVHCHQNTDSDGNELYVTLYVTAFHNETSAAMDWLRLSRCIKSWLRWLSKLVVLRAKLLYQ